MRLDLDGLAAASREALMAEWCEVVGRPPPKHLSKPLKKISDHDIQLTCENRRTRQSSINCSSPL